MLPTTNQPIQGFIEEDIEEDFDDGDLSAPPDDETPQGLILPDPTVRFTFNPVSTANQVVTEEQQKLQIASLVTQHGNLKDPNVRLRFIIGPGERRKAPGRGPGEVDRFKRAWNKLQDFNANHNWRRIISNEFEGDYYDEAMPFTIDGLEWLSVYHYLLGMLYSKTPSYAILYSMSSKESESGFWSKVRAAKREHDKNLTYGVYPIDMQFASKLEGYLRQAWLAKFSQNPLAKTALLLTEDAVLSIRGIEGILDLPLLMQVREQIKADPTAVYKGASAPVEHLEEELPIINTTEELNYGYVDRDNLDIDKSRLIAGGITPDNLYRKVSLAESLVPAINDLNQQMTTLNPVSSERDLQLLKLRSIVQVLGTANFVNPEILEIAECVVYVATGAYKIDVGKLILEYGYPKFVRRHIYALETAAYDTNSQLLIGIQRTPVSQMSEYLVINTEISSQPKIPISIYLEPFAGGFGIFIIAANRDNQVLDFLRYLTQTAPFSEAP